MREIPTLFVRDPARPRIWSIGGSPTLLVTDQVDPDCQWVIDGEGEPTEKIDGTACAVFQGTFYRRHVHKAEKGNPPGGWLHWSLAPEQKSGHGWLPVLEDSPQDRYHREAYVESDLEPEDGTYELVGPKVNKNAYRLANHQLWRHGDERLEIVFSRIDHLAVGHFLETFRPIEGIVWHHPDGRMAKIKRRDYGIPWPAPWRR